MQTFIDMFNKITCLSVISAFVLGFNTNLKANEFRVFAGPSFSKIITKAPGIGYSPEMKFRTAFHAGAGYEIELHKNFSLEPRLQFSSKGIKYRGIAIVIDDEDSGDYIYATSVLRLNYLEIPVIAKAVLPVDETKKISIGVGPYLGIALNGKAVSKIDGFNEKETEQVEFGNEGLKRLDMGLKIEGGFTFKNYSLHLFYDQGFISMVNPAEAGGSMKNRSLGISLGYVIPSKQKDGKN